MLLQKADLNFYYFIGNCDSAKWFGNNQIFHIFICCILHSSMFHFNSQYCHFNARETIKLSLSCSQNRSLLVYRAIRVEKKCIWTNRPLKSDYHKKNCSIHQRNIIMWNSRMVCHTLDTESRVCDSKGRMHGHLKCVRTLSWSFLILSAGFPN